jgi:hypothetical protein
MVNTKHFCTVYPGLNHLKVVSGECIFIYVHDQILSFSDDSFWIFDFPFFLTKFIADPFIYDYALQYSILNLIPYLSNDSEAWQTHEGFENRRDFTDLPDNADQQSAPTLFTV